MDGKLINRLEHLVNAFACSRTSCSFMMKLGELVFGIRREDWINVAWEVFNEVDNIIMRNGYQIMVVLTFPLKFSDHEMKAPSRLSLNVLDKYISPGIILTRLSLESYVSENKCVQMPRFDDSRQPYKFYYSQYWSYGDFRRSIDILPTDYCGMANAGFCRNDDSKLAYIVESWVNDFAMNPDANSVSDDIDYFVRNIRRNDWISASWDVYQMANDIITHNGYFMSAILIFRLKDSNSKRNAPVKLSTTVLHKSTPPSIVLTRIAPEKWQMSEKCVLLQEYSEDHPEYMFCYSQYWLDGDYSRSVDVFVK
ncbi:hypothetical protein [uncultured Phocaeicola sp.]|uniref:hypothetical protein n=1 Tax=uncultured Phocaeicola sp. TaxID=990718 RepID=UPI002629D6F3|nr:hypothetical protein [uncultured Phocaeicola sp.]